MTKGTQKELNGNYVLEKISDPKQLSIISNRVIAAVNFANIPVCLGMSHWLNETVPVKSETRSPTHESSGSILGTNSNLDSATLFGSNPVTIDSLQATNTFEHKQEYYFYNSMQQYTPTFYSSYGSPYSSRTAPKIPSPNAYLSSGYATSSSNNSSQLYSSYGYNNFGQFGAAQQEYSGYYNEQYSSSYYNASNYSPFVSSAATSGGQSFHAGSGLSDNQADGHPATPTLLAHSPMSPLSISPNNSSIANKITPSSKSGRTRGRRHAHPSPTRSANSETPLADNVKTPERVFIWDLDETIIIFHSLLTGSYAKTYSKDPHQLVQLGYRMEELIFNMADTHFFFNDVEDCDQVHIDDVSSDDNGQDLNGYNFTTDGFHSGTPQGKYSFNFCFVFIYNNCSVTTKILNAS